MPKRSPDYMRDRRRRIIDAARTVALGKAWPRVTIDDVAASAGLSKGAIYVHFASKRDLLAGLIDVNVDEIDAIADLPDAAVFRDYVFERVGMLCGPLGWEIAVSTSETQIEGVRDPELRPRIEAAAERLTFSFTRMLARFLPNLCAAEIERRALTLIMLIEGMRSFRVISGAVDEARQRAALEPQLKALLEP